jgi:hypothetical protein
LQQQPQSQLQLIPKLKHQAEALWPATLNSASATAQASAYFFMARTFD